MGRAACQKLFEAIAGPAEAEEICTSIEATGAGERALAPVVDPPLSTLWGASFQPVGEVDYRGFRLIHLRSATAVAVAPAPPDDGSPSSPTALVLGP